MKSFKFSMVVVVLVAFILGAVVGSAITYRNVNSYILQKQREVSVLVEEVKKERLELERMIWTLKFHQKSLTSTLQELLPRLSEED